MVTGVAGVKAAIAADYDATAAGWAAFADRLYFRFLCAPLAHALGGIGGPVLDVASGSGALGRALPWAVATDLSHAQLRHNPLRWRVRADAERLPFRTDAFAGVACAFGINHFPDPLAALHEMARVAPHVGLLTWARGSRDYAPRTAVARVVQARLGPVVSPGRQAVERLEAGVDRPHELRTLLRGAGLAGEVEVVAVDVPWPGPEAYVDFRLALSPDLGELREPLRAEAVAAVAALPDDALAFRPELLLALGTRA